MDVLAGYDTSSDDEKEPRSQKRKSATPVAEEVSSEHGMREGNVEMTEIKGESKEMLPISPSASSRREESHRNRRYRQRSASPRESPSKQSPTSRGSGREERRENTRSKSRSRSHSPNIRRGSRSKSPNRSNERDGGQTDEFGRDLRPPHRRLSSKEPKDLDRSHSRSPEKRESKERPRHREHRRSPGRDGRERRPSYRRDRDRDRDRRDHDRNPRDRDRDRGRHERGRNWSDRRRSSEGYERSRDRRRSGETERDDKVSKSPETAVAPKPPPKPGKVKPLSSEEIQAKLSAQAELMKCQAQQAAAALNMPTYLNPSVVNPQQYAVQAQKRKLLWSAKNKETPTAVWNATSFSNDTSGQVQAKFRRLMGIKEGEAAGQQPDPGDTDNPGTQSQQLMDDLENEFERSRAFQLSRGAGGKSGIGLGYTGM